jgi:hypothetical protein
LIGTLCEDRGTPGTVTVVKDSLIIAPHSFIDQIIQPNFLDLSSWHLITARLQKLLTHLSIDQVKVILHMMVVQNDKGVFQLNAMSIQWY